MSQEFKVEIISPERSIIKVETTEVIVPSYEGEIGILKDHVPLITFLRPGFLTIKSQGEKKFFVEEGTIEFSNNNLLILTSTAKAISDITKEFLDSSITDSQKKLDSNDISDKERYLMSYKLESLKNFNQ